MTSLLKTLISLFLLPPAPALGLPPDQNLSLLIGKTMHVLAECGRKQSVTDSGEVTFVTSPPEQSQVSSQSVLPPADLDWLLGPKQSDGIFDRVLSRIVQLEAHESNPHFYDDYRIAWHIVRFCQTGEAVMCSESVLAWYTVLGCHPDHVWPRIVARRQALLGNPEFVSARKQQARSEPAGADKAPSPNKKSAPVTSIPKKESA